MRLAVGIDQSVRHTGICALAENGSLVLLTLVEPVGLEEGARLAYIESAVQEALGAGEVEAVVMEGYSYNSVNKKFLLGEVGATVKLAVFKSGAALYIAAPKQLKKFVTGKGSSDKEDIMSAVYARWHVKIDNDNLADAYGLARIAHEIIWPKTAIRAQLEVVQMILKKGTVKALPRPKVLGFKGAL
jgi:crossover junction endodeoxyribonuclease RuvC